MKLFTKRYKNSRPLNLINGRDELGRRVRGNLLNQETRNRLISEIRFLTSNNDYLEWFILFENEKKEKIFFDENKLDNFSLAELGYKFSDYFVFSDFAMLSKTEKRFDDREVEVFEDPKLFDLVEVIILFSKEEKRDEIVNRLNTILIEENESFHIQDNFVVKKQEEDIQTILPLIKDQDLKNKLELFYVFSERSDFINAAKVSSDIINIIFSDYFKDYKKQKIEEILDSLSKKIIGSSRTETDIEKRKTLSVYLNELLKNSKDLTNNVYGIRHSEKSTIKPKTLSIYKLIAFYNISLIEFAIISLKKDYVLGENWEKIKTEYIKKYKINRNVRLIIKKPEEDDEQINLDDIPF